MLINIIYLLINIIIINIHEMNFVHWCRVSQVHEAHQIEAPSGQAQGSRKAYPVKKGNRGISGQRPWIHPHINWIVFNGNETQ
jgi:hypothetical protein